MNKTFKITLAFFAFTLITTAANHPTHSKNLYKESDYQRLWCSNAGGKAEYILADRTRVDCLTDEYAVEIDFAKKWAEAIGQALYYGSVTGKRPAVLLIMENPKDKRYLLRLRRVAVTTKFKIMTITPAYLNKDHASNPAP